VPHVIRLRGPWEWERRDGSDHGTRRFGRPTLPAGERVWLVIESPRTIAEVRLNGAALPANGPGAGLRFDVTDLLAWRNELTLRLEEDGDKAGLDVRLEITRAP